MIDYLNHPWAEAMRDSDRVAVVLVNYNMPERTDALCEHILAKETWPHELIVVDNGSDLVLPSRYTTVRLENNVQTTNGWLEGLRYAKSICDDWLAYWFLITSAEFLPDSRDVLSSLVSVLKTKANAVGVHPALTRDTDTAWKHLIVRGGELVRQTWAIENIASLYRSDWFDRVGWFDPQLIYAWGIASETGWKARKDGRSLWVHEGCPIRKVTNIGYTMERMNMTAKERAQLASQNVREVFSERYGRDFLERLAYEYRTEDMN